MRIAVSCGGTGGHMFPGLAVAGELRRRGHDVAVVLSGRAAENGRAEKDVPTGVQTLLIPSRPFGFRRPLSLLGAMRSVLRARKAFRSFHPEAVLAMGSYTSFAPVVAARLHLRRSRRIPVILHEANAIPGSAVARLSRFATTICTCFPGMARFFPKRVRVADTGLPLRASFTQGSGSAKVEEGSFPILVMGGSQGARAVNSAVVGALNILKEKHPSVFEKIRIVHLAGADNQAQVSELYASSGFTGEKFEILGFSNQMPRHYAESALCISRAGASSCFELALAGIPAIFIPLSGLANDHQVRNAEAMSSRGAGAMLAGENATPENLAAEIARFANSAPLRNDARKAQLSLARPDAASRVADEIERIGNI